MMKELEAAFDGDEKVSFLYIQTVFEGAKSNTFERGKADIKKVRPERSIRAGQLQKDDAPVQKPAVRRGWL